MARLSAFLLSFDANLSKEEAAGCLLTLAGVLPAIGVVVVVLPLDEEPPLKEDFPDELAGLLLDELPPLKEDLFPEEEEELPPKADLLLELDGELPPPKEDLFPEDGLLLLADELPPLKEDFPLLLDEEPPEKEDLLLEEDDLLLLLPPLNEDRPLEEDEPPENDERPEELLLDDRPDEEEPPENEDRPEEELLDELDRLPPPF